MTEILPRFYVGCLIDARCQSRLSARKITHVVSVHDMAAPPPDEQRRYLCIQASDSPRQDLSDFFSIVNDFVHQGRCEGAVLIHCLAGVSRSVTLAAAYIMTVSNLSWTKALNVVRGARRIANPNLGFKQQLRRFEAHGLTKERKRFREKFPVSDACFEDEQACQRMLVQYERWVQFGDRLQHDSENSMVEEMAQQSFAQPARLQPPS